MISNCLTVLSADLVGCCVNLDLSFSRWLVMLPRVALLQLLPGSLGGLGVREATVVAIFGKLGIPGQTALAA